MMAQAFWTLTSARTPVKVPPTSVSTPASGPKPTALTKMMATISSWNVRPSVMTPRPVK